MAGTRRLPTQPLFACSAVPDVPRRLRSRVFICSLKPIPAAEQIRRCSSSRSDSGAGRVPHCVAFEIVFGHVLHGNHGSLFR